MLLCTYTHLSHSSDDSFRSVSCLQWYSTYYYSPLHCGAEVSIGLRSIYTGYLIAWTEQLCFIQCVLLIVLAPRFCLQEKRLMIVWVLEDVYLIDSHVFVKNLVPSELLSTSSQRDRLYQYLQKRTVYAAQMHWCVLVFLNIDFVTCSF